MSGYVQTTAVWVQHLYALVRLCAIPASAVPIAMLGELCNEAFASDPRV